MNAIMDAKDAISAKLAECWVTIEGNRYNLMSLTKFEAKFKGKHPWKARIWKQTGWMGGYLECNCSLQPVIVPEAASGI